MIPFIIAELFAVLASFSFLFLFYGMLTGSGAGGIVMVPFFFGLTVYAMGPVVVGAFICRLLARKLNGLAYLASTLAVGIVATIATAFCIQQWAPPTESTAGHLARVFASPLIALPTLVSLVAWVYLAKVRFKEPDANASK